MPLNLSKMSYKLLFHKEADRSLRGLDHSVAQRILRKLQWLADNAEQVTGEGLRADLTGKMKLREGDYRVVYRFQREEGAVIVYAIGHRNEIYKK